ncbi:N-acetylmuramoyl-L-alanine amidase [Paraclostridium bifermentans]|uniref:N-acetylmuramoyl-L-alanine amidase n=1 Tax=Paraclostridium bifermentans TaxID=1490 RepID=UPI001FF643C8|nr:N-acetylmuramoyl-L-alanine amidase [Paraclostridium bifermentans]UOW68786.1 N-acetylmuramoyl-L-alanine amidase [Paraclostridium bifermentans]
MKITTIRKSVVAVVLSTAFMSTMTVSHANNYKVFIDAGHGGNDNGSAYNNRIEDNLNLQIANKVEAKLQKRGIDVMTSRKSDEYVSLRERTNKSNLADVDMFVSIHQNAAEDTTTKGIETFYYNDENKEFADVVQKSLLSSTNGLNRGVKKGNLQVLRDNEAPAVLVECGFISNEDEGSKLTTNEYQEKVANGIVDGVISNLGFKDEKGLKVNKNVAIALSDGVCVRNGRGSMFNSIGYLSKGEKVEVLDTKFDWHKIKFNGHIGYVSNVYVK